MLAAAPQSVPHTPPADRTVITVDSRRIGAEEFESRINIFSVGLPKDPVQRKQFAALGLIQEEILAQAARAAHLDTLPQARIARTQFEKEAVYEEWMNREVRANVRVSDAEIIRTYPLYKEQLILDYRVYRDSASARRAEPRFRRELAGTAAPADTLTQTKDLEYGEAQKPIEDALFSLKEGDTRILHTSDGWYLFGLRAVKPHPTRSKQSFPEAYQAIARLVHREKEVQMLGKKMSAIMAGRAYRLAPQARQHLFRLLSERIPFSKPEITKFPEIVNQEMGRHLPPATDMKEPLLTFKDGTKMTLGQLWNLLSVGPYLLNYRSPEELRGGIDYLIRRVIMVETVTAAAYKEGLNRAPAAMVQTAMWTDNLLSDLFQYRLSESRLPTAAELTAEADSAKGSPAQIRDRVLQKKTHAAIDSVMNAELPRHTVLVDTSALYSTHALEGDVVVRKEHFPNRFAVPRLVPPNPEAAWAVKLMRAWGVQP